MVDACWVFVVLFLYPGFWRDLRIFSPAPRCRRCRRSKMIAKTGVITPFMVHEVTALVASWSAALCAVPDLGVRCPGLYDHAKKFRCADHRRPAVPDRRRVWHYCVFGTVFRFINDFAPKSITPAPDIEAYFSFGHHHVHGLRVTLRSRCGIILVRSGWLASRADACPPLRDCERFVEQRW